MKKISTILLTIFLVTACVAEDTNNMDIAKVMQVIQKQLAQSTIVVYNTKHPASKKIARHYMEKRNIPDRNLISVSLPFTSEISRSNYIEQIEQPIVNQLLKKDFLGYEKITNSYVVTNCSIRYLVLCRGIPFIIKDPALNASAAVDNDLACITLRQKHEHKIGALKNPAYFAEIPYQITPTNGVLITARLDAPSDNVAYHLVDKALEGEKRGFWGNIYIDSRGIEKPPYATGDEWLMQAYTNFTHAGYSCHLDTKEATFGENFEMPTTIFYAGWYSYSANGPFKSGKVRFAPGAIAYHLHSYSAKNIYSSTDHWVGPLLNLGAACTVGYVDEPFLTQTLNVGMFTDWLLKGTTFGEAAYHSLSTISWQATIIGDPLYRPMMPQNKKQMEKAIKSYPEIRKWMDEKKRNLSKTK